jgi:hypothetical protein
VSIEIREEPEGTERHVDALKGHSLQPGGVWVFWRFACLRRRIPSVPSGSSLISILTPSHPPFRRVRSPTSRPTMMIKTTLAPTATLNHHLFRAWESAWTEQSPHLGHRSPGWRQRQSIMSYHSTGNWDRHARKCALHIDRPVLYLPHEALFVLAVVEERGGRGRADTGDRKRFSTCRKIRGALLSFPNGSLCPRPCLRNRI